MATACLRFQNSTSICAVIIDNGGGLCRCAFARRSPGCLDDGFRHAEVQRIFAGGHINAKSAQQPLTRQNVACNTNRRVAPFVLAMRLLEFESGGVALNSRRSRYRPAILTGSHFAIDRLVDGIIVLREVGTRIDEFRDGVRRVGAGGPFQFEFAQDEIAIACGPGPKCGSVSSGKVSIITPVIFVSGRMRQDNHIVRRAFAAGGADAAIGVLLQVSLCPWQRLLCGSTQSRWFWFRPD